MEDRTGRAQQSMRYRRKLKMGPCLEAVVLGQAVDHLLVRLEKKA